MKECSKCHKQKELSEFVKDKNKKDGVRGICKECYNLSKRKTPVKPKSKEGYKYCSKCKKELLLSEFNIRMINGNKKLFSYCKECERKYNNNRYKHICKECGKEYFSGKKVSKICNECRIPKFAEIGKKTLIAYNKIPENNFWYGKHRTGIENPNYNPNKTDEEREVGRIIEGYKEWRNSVYKRDNYICQCCGYDKGRKLNAHHLDGYEWCKEKRTDIQNGVTLCEDCHKNFHKLYGLKGNTKEQFYKFKTNKEYLYKNNKLIPR